MLRCHGSSDNRPLLAQFTLSDSRLNNVAIDHGRQHMGQMGSADPLEKLMKTKKRKHAKRTVL